MLKAMSKLVFKNKTVLDFGSGTGILAIYASLQGATSVTAIDNEQPAIDNIADNLELNEITNVMFQLGDENNLPGGEYDIILANITRNVILDAIGVLVRAGAANSHYLFSGFFEEDLPAIKTAASGLNFIDSTLNGNWCIAHFQKA